VKWQEQLARLVEEYYQWETQEKEAKNQKKSLRTQIIKIMKKQGIKEFSTDGLRVLYWIAFDLPTNVEKLRTVIGRFWRVVARRKISYWIDRKRIEGKDGYLETGKIDPNEWRKILIVVEKIKVEPTERK